MTNDSKLMRLFMLFCGILLVVPNGVICAVPATINYQGHLTDSGGAPLEGSQLIIFALYDDPLAGTLIWSEQQTVAARDGVFNVQLGAVLPLAVADFASDTLYLELQIFSSGTGWEILTPRQSLTSTAFAMHAADADTLEGLAAADFAAAVHEHDAAYVNAGEADAVTSAMVAPNTLTAADLAANAVGASELANNAVEAAAIATGAVTNAKIYPNAVDSGKIADGSVTAGDLADGTTIAEILDDDGSGSGLDADLLDGLNSSAFMPAATDNWVNITGDSMTGGLSIGGSDISIGVDIEVDGSTLNIVGVDSSVYATEGYAQGLRIAANTGTENSRGTLGINVNADHGGTGYLHGIDIDANHYGTAGEAHGVDIYLIGSDTGDVKGVHAESRKYASDTGGTAFGAHFIGDSDRTGGDAYGVLGEALATDGRCYGLYGRATRSGNADFNYGVLAEAGSTHSRSYGLLAKSSQSTVSSSTGYAGYFEANADADSTSAIYGIRPYVFHHGASGTSYGAAIYVSPSDTGNAYGIYSQVNSSSTTGNTYAGYFSGDVHVTGTLSKGGGSFKIDHPLDPENKYLQHSFVESPDMKNVYDGVANLDDEGEAWVKLPDYFKALNRDYRYQLTCIGGFAPVYISEEISDNRFKITGGVPGMKVSWQVTGIRRDDWAEANRIEVEVDKDETERGAYLYPEVFGLNAERGVEYAHNPERW